MATLHPKIFQAAYILYYQSVAMLGMAGSAHDVEKNENKTEEIICCDFQPKPTRLFSTVDPTVKTDPRLARTRPNGSRGK
jgi:hypothetical protein